MTERDALIRAICSNPVEDTPRLVYADWLDEHEESERAEFIRIQIAVARTPTPGLRARERQLWEMWYILSRNVDQFDMSGHVANFNIVEPRLPFSPVGGATHGVVRRGFLDSLTLTAANLESHASAIFSLSPIQAVNLIGIAPAPIDPPDDGESGEVWHAAWFRRSVDQHEPDALPEFLWPHLLAVSGYTIDAESIYYHNATHASAALSRAGVRFGRVSAGLPV
jgi:uncharacterized protein (TIGR02996 family)